MCSENKGTDRLRGYREAGLRLCFGLCRLLVFSCGGSYLMAPVRLNAVLIEVKQKTDHTFCFYLIILFLLPSFYEKNNKNRQ